MDQKRLKQHVWLQHIRSKHSITLDPTSHSGASSFNESRDDSGVDSPNSSLDSAEVDDDELEDWLEDEAEEEQAPIPPSQDEELELGDVSVEVITSNEYLSAEKELRSQLRAVADLQFDLLDVSSQEDLMRSVTKMKVAAGEVIIQQGADDDGGCFYMVLGPSTAQVEVVRLVNGGCHPLILPSFLTNH